MTILHVLSQFEVTGAEVYAVTLAEEQLRRGHRVLIVSDTLGTPTTAQYISFPIGNRRYSQRLRNIRFLIELLRREHVQIIHAHSRAASWVSLWAARRTSTPFVSTVHGRQHLHASSRSFSVYGRYIIAVNESLKQHLVSDLGIVPDSVSVVPNGFDITRWRNPVSSPSKQEMFGIKGERPVLLVAGRLSGPKGDIVRFLLDHVVPSLFVDTHVSLQIVGGNTAPADIAASVDRLRKQWGSERIALRPHQSDLRPYYACADVVLGAGRIAVEAAVCGRPVVAFGESAYLGPVTEHGVDQFAASNFGDTGLSIAPDAGRILDDLCGLLRSMPAPRALRAISDRMAEQFDIDSVADRIQRIYERARRVTCTPVSIPVLMYHRVVKAPPAGSKHGLWVTAEAFEAQLASLRRRNITSVTFTLYDRFVRGEAELPPRPVILTFDDGYADNCEVAFPILQKFGMTAVIYLVTDKVRRTNFWDPDEPQEPLLDVRQIVEMARAGIEFGSHTVAHADLPQYPADQARRELSESRSWIEELIAQPVVSFAYPYGRLTTEVKKAVEETGYRYAVAADSGPLRFSDDLFEIRRSQVFPWTGAFGFWKKTQPWYIRYKARKKQETSNPKHQSMAGLPPATC